MTPAGLPHSDTPGSQLGCQLPRAYRRLQRPSSALDAKASTMCPSQLVSQTLNKNNKRHTPPPAQSHQQQGHYKTKDNNPPTNQEKTPTSRTGCRQMLASTIHISNTPPTNPTHQHTANRQRRRHRTNKPHPQEKPPGAFAGLIPQGPTACQNPRTRRSPGPEDPPAPPATTQVPHPQLTPGVVLRTMTRRTRAFIDDSTSEHHQSQPHGWWLRGVCAP